MNWDLVIDKGTHKGQLIPIDHFPFFIGRDDDCQLRPISLYVSHCHCALIRQGNQMIVRDCNSTNGTFLNNHRVKGEVEIHSGDRLRIGPLAFVISTRPAAAGNQQIASAKPGPAQRTVNEDAIAAMLLEMDKEEEEPEVQANNARGKQEIPARESEANSTKDSEKPPSETAQDEHANSPSEVAAAILGKKRMEWQRRRARNPSSPVEAGSI
jgi:pSer/pThr/pTyr-binding forkhead associated (FHA) protein